MKRVFFLCKKPLFAIASVLFICLLYLNISKPLFTGLSDEYRIYTESGSYNNGIEIKSDMDYLRILGKKGESCAVKGYSVNDIMQMYNCRLCFTEETDGGISFYCFSKDMRYVKRLKGKNVSLQIYCKNDVIVIGSPIIYGGY